jgi:bifunctional polynucleotide phosphatase/kinase
MWNDKVPEKLKELHKDGWKLVIFTNQGGVAKGHLTAQAVISRVEAFIEAAVGTDVPFMVLAAAGDDHHRKPATGMWDHMVKDYFGNDPKRIDMTKSVYVGDAAGRPKEWNGNKKTKKDHSCGDRKFAMNVGIAFHTPEEFFLGEPEYKGWKLDVYDVKKHWATNDKKPYNTKDLISDKQELVVFAGFPASGKSTFFKKHFLPNGYVHVNRDTLQTPAKCQKAAVEALKQGKSVVIDNTNPDVESRKAYLKIARDAKVQARCFQFTTPRDLAEHLNMMREKLTEGASKHVPGVAYNTYNKKRVEVSDKEGWDEVKEIEFVPDFADDLAKTRFFEYT